MKIFFKTPFSNYLLFNHFVIMKLTENAISDIYNKKKIDENGSVYLQVVEILAGKTPIRVKAYLSDGTHFMEASVLTSVLEPASVHNTNVYRVLKVNRFNLYNASSVQTILAVMDCSIVEGGAKSLIGIPCNIDKSDSAFRLAVSVPPPVVALPPPVAPAVSSSSSSTIVVPTAATNYTMLKSLVVGATGDKILKLRVTGKTRRSYSNARGSGYVGNIHFMDDKGSQVRTTFFNDSLDKFSKVFNENYFYEIENFSLQELTEANRKYAFGIGHELVIKNDTKITLLKTEAPGLSSAAASGIEFNLIKIDKIPDCKVKDTIDVAGIIHYVSDFKTIPAKDGSNREVCMRTVKIVDNSGPDGSDGMSVDVTIWGKEHETKFMSERCLYKMLAIKNCVVGEYQDKVKLSLGNTSQPYFDLTTHTQLKPLFDWWNTKDRNQFRPSKMDGFTSPEASGAKGTPAPAPISILEIQSKKIGDRPEYYTVSGNISQFVDSTVKDLWYIACSNDSCMKQLINQHGKLWCEACKRVVDQSRHCYSFPLVISDCSAGLPCRAFDEAGQVIFEKTADELQELKGMDSDINSILAFNKFVDSRLFKEMTFTIQCKQQTRKTDDGEEKKSISYTIQKCSRKLQNNNDDDDDC